MRSDELLTSLKDTRKTFDEIFDKLLEEQFYLDQTIALYHALKVTNALTPACEVEMMQLIFQFEKVLIDLRTTRLSIEKVVRKDSTT